LKFSADSRHPGARAAGVSKDAFIVNACLYILLCAHDSYYAGTTVGDLETRMAEHQAGVYHGYTAL
jgi:predicted GIY-YIG superfamily endonuclease